MKMSRINRIRFVGLFLILWISGVVSAASASDVVIIANKTVPLSTLTSSTIKEIFLGNKSTWDNVSRIAFAVLEYGEAHNKFLRTYVKKSAAQYNNYWRQQMFTGKGQMPITFNSDKAMLDYVASTPGAIGYVSNTADTGTVKIITAN